MNQNEEVTKDNLSTIEVKDYNIMIDEQNLFDQPVRNDLITYDNIWKIATGQEDITQLVVCWTIIILNNIIR